MYFHQTRYAIFLLTEYFRQKETEKLKEIQNNLRTKEDFSIIELAGNSAKDKEMLKRILSKKQVSAVLNTVLENNLNSKQKV